MLDRILKLVVTLTLVLFLAQAVIGVLARVLESALRASLSVVGSVGGYFGSALAAPVIACFALGLLTRGIQFIANRDQRTARERAMRDRAVRQRARRPAENVPPIGSHTQVLDDPDPAIGEEERQ